jgi:hypothetical protein
MRALFYHVQLTTSTPSSAFTGSHPPPASPLRHRDVRAIAKRKFLDDQEQQDFLGKINNTSVVVWYPDDLSAMVSQYPEAIAQDYLERTQELILWVRQDLRLQTL